MCNKDRIRAAILGGSEGKRRRRDVKAVLADVDGYTEKVYKLLITGTYVPTKPKIKRIKDVSSGKDREISIVPYYPDGIMHQLVVGAMKRVIMRGMYRWSCASIPGRGNKCAADYVKRALKKDRKGTKYCAKMDIYHFYPSIRTDVMMSALRRKIKDKRFLKLIEDIISSNGEGGFAIGFYTNQWLANFLLEPLDHLITTLSGVKYYVRNADDIVIMGPSKKKLHRAVRAIGEYLKGMRLKLKKNWQVFPVDARGIDFVGYRFYHTHTTMRRRNFLRFARQCRRAEKRLRSGRGIPLRMAQGLLSRAGQLKHCDSAKAQEKYFNKIGRRRLTAVIRKEARRKNMAAAA